jgi:hypothetical protein
MFHQRGCYPNDAAAGFLREHLFNRELSDVDIAFQIGGRERLEVLRRIGSERLRKEYARIIDERVDRPEFGYSGLGNFRSGCGLTNVAIDQRQLV